MVFKRFTLAVCFNRNETADFTRESAWKSVCEAVYPDDAEEADLYEYSNGSVFGCVLTNMRLGKSRRVSAGLGRNLAVMASVDWLKPFILENELKHSADLKAVGRIDEKGEFVPAEGEKMKLAFSGPKGKRWINPWKKKRMLLVWPDGERSAQQIARGILSASEQKRTEKDVVIFTVEQDFMPDILLFLNDYRRESVRNGEGAVINAAVCPDGTVILGDVSGRELKDAADHFSAIGCHRIIAETDSNAGEDTPGVEIAYLSASDHIINLFTTYGFERIAKWCDRAAVIVPDHVPEEAIPFLDRAGLNYKVYQTPQTEAERAAVISELLDK
ncbi:MAG: hypothetical protein IIV93_04345 [Clostridia bacterium]|nr:hypothetical protein [Clostridia bacterium]